MAHYGCELVTSWAIASARMILAFLLQLQLVDRLACHYNILP